MAIPLYLALTAAEFAACPSLPEHNAWMACHFSPYSTGLSNCPSELPDGSIIILNDRTPIHGHDPSLISEQLKDLIEEFQTTRILLDFQRPDCPETFQLTRTLVRSLPCPVGVSEAYAQDLDSPVFLTPPKLTSFLADHMSPWAGREIWLEAALDSMCFTVTESGCYPESLPVGEKTEFSHLDQNLHCHYRIEQQEHAVRFILHRSKEDLTALLSEAESLGITTAVGLFQELGKM